ncbi:AAA family ATPase [Butyrivibrio sp. JL13D10]|uniref:AAA family ATPase n=1 Tax=Butyrivibrio sp. JL13D10 TaxID=3236815 RepID=UPI0038B68BA4
MRFKVAIVDKDNLYLQRIARVFSEKYAENMDLYSFSSLEAFENRSVTARFDMVLYGEGIIPVEDIPNGQHAMYLVSQADIDKVEGVSAICKYQKHEILFKKIVSFCIDQDSTNYIKKNVMGNACKVILVAGASGGSGATTVATALSRFYARNGKKVLYISFEKNPATSLFFNSESESSFSDVIYMLKSKKSNIISRLENIVQKDETGVFFFNQCKTIFDMEELTDADKKTLIEEICSFGEYDYVIMDDSITCNKSGYAICDYSDMILLVSDGSKLSEMKLDQISTVIGIWDEEKDARFRPKTRVFYNGNLNPAESDEDRFMIMGAAPKFEGMTERAVSERVSELGVFQQLA